jgi:hypothetical protein
MSEQNFREEYNSTSDVIRIIPHERSPITQQLEAWFQSVVSSRMPNYWTNVKTRNFEAMAVLFIEIVTPDGSHHLSKHMERSTLSGVNEQPCALEMQSSLVIEEKHMQMEISEVHSQSQEQAAANGDHELGALEHVPDTATCLLHTATCLLLRHLQLLRVIHGQLFSRLVLPPLLPPLS